VRKIIRVGGISGGGDVGKGWGGGGGGGCTGWGGGMVVRKRGMKVSGKKGAEHHEGVGNSGFGGRGGVQRGGKSGEGEGVHGKVGGVVCV